MSGVSIGGIAYAFASTSRTLSELAAAGELQSAPELLERFGFDRVHVAIEESPYDLALVAARRLLQEQAIDPADVDMLIYGGTPAAMSFAPAHRAPEASAALCTTERFHFPAARLQYELGLDHASVMGLDQLACTTLFGAVRLARALCASEGLARVLCVSAEFFPARAGRESIFNCCSDAACAVLVEHGGERNRIVGSASISKGYYWNADILRDEVLASYFPTARCVIERTVRDAGWQASDVSWVVPHNVSRRSWEILHRLAGLPNARVFTDNIPRRGHALAGDNFINLRDAIDAGVIRRGDRVLLFAYGFGAHWTGLALEA